MLVNNPLQEIAAAERGYVEARAELEARERALRAEYQHIQQSDPSAEVREKVGRFVAAQAASARRQIREAVNSPEFEERLGEIVYPILCMLSPQEVERAIVAEIVPDQAAKSTRLADLKKEIDDVAAKLLRLYDINRSLTNPLR